jgi:DNA-binding response OmpR family regulator
MKNLLIAERLKPIMMDATAFLRRSDIAVHTAASNEEILRHHLEKGSHLIVTTPSLPGMACETLFHIIRRGDTMKKVSLFLICEDTPLHQELARRCSSNAVMTMPVHSPLFADKVRQLLDISPRQSYRVILKITADGRNNNRPVMCNSVNISTSGMLIRAKEDFSRGDRIACSFHLPDGRRVSADGNVVRSFRDRASDVGHYGVRFQALGEGSQAAIASFIEWNRKARTSC